MKLSMECEVRSKTLLSGEIPILFNDRTYIFTPDASGCLSKIKIIAEVKDPSKFYSVITKNPKPGIKLNINAKVDLELYDSVLKEFQELESILAFKFNLQGVDWRSPRYDLIFDSDEEREKAELFGFQSKTQYKNLPKQATPDGLLEVLQHKQRLDPLIAPLSFYREGMNDHFAFKHINAFFNFYFVVEGLYGNGKTKNRDVENELKNSSAFTRYVQIVLEQVKNEQPAYYEQIERMLSNKRKNMGVNEVIELVVSTRGELHHFQNNPNRAQGTPFRHSEYQAIAYVAMGLALHSLLGRLVEINQAALAAKT